MKEIKKISDSDIGFRGKILIAFEVVCLLTLTILTVAVIKGDISLKNGDSSLKVSTRNYTENSIVYKEGLTFPPTQKDENNATKVAEESNTVVNNSQGSVNNSGLSSQVDTNNQALSESSVNNSVLNSQTDTNKQTLADPSGWSNAKIISKAKDAVNKTKAYTGNLTVRHTEGFSANVTECTGGTIVASVVNLMIGWVVKPVDETLHYQNGKAVNSEGETIPIILPKRNGFSLNENGVESATVQRAGNEYVIKINLVEESVGMYDVPTHNAASVGYLDVADFDISFMDIDSADVIYKGSSIELRINADGFVTYASYNIPLHIDGSAHKGSISGSATFDGAQSETWILNY